MEPDFSKYVLEGDNSSYASESGLVVPVVTRGGLEVGATGQSAGATRISGVSAQHTPATKLWFGKVSNESGYRSVPHHHGEAETGVMSSRAGPGSISVSVSRTTSTSLRATGSSSRRSCRTSSAISTATTR